MKYLKTSAVISECGKYRYLLERSWYSSSKTNTALFVMLNPSTADANEDDPTIRRVVSFADKFNCSNLIVANLYAFRATSPEELKQAKYPVSSKDNEQIRLAAARADLIIVAWGANAQKKRAKEVLSILRQYGKVFCLGMTKTAFPKHPLYLAKNTELQEVFI